MTLYINYNTIKSWACESPLIHIYHCEIYLYLFVLFFFNFDCEAIYKVPSLTAGTREMSSIQSSQLEHTLK